MIRIKRLSRSSTRSALVALVTVVAAAHVGSPNVFYVGKAGVYDVTVVVRPPQVVPGLAEITVRIPEAQARDVKRVVVRPVYWATGTRGSPAGDEATRVPAPEPTYAGKLWFMQGGSYSVYVEVEGARGNGSVSIPVAAVATAQLRLTGFLKALLVVLGFVLFFGLLTIVRAAAGESLVPPGEQMDAKRRRAARLATAIALPLLVLIVFGGWRWWVGEAEAYRRTLYRPLAVESSVTPSAVGGLRFRLQITDPAWVERRMTAIIPDHGKMMHLFLIDDSNQDVFAHLHPAMVDSTTFEATLPPLPAGRYRVYGDIVHESGFERTLVSAVDVPAAPPATAAPGDSDDAIAVLRASVPLGASASADIGDGLRLASETIPATLTAGRATELRFRLLDGSAASLAIEPYLGMPAHAVVNRRDGSVYIHLHPMGTVSVAAQQAFALRDQGDTTAAGRLRLADTAIAGAITMAMGAPDGRVSFTYEFPKPGQYRLWVQVKQGGKVRTGVFDVDVR